MAKKKDDNLEQIVAGRMRNAAISLYHELKAAGVDETRLLPIDLVSVDVTDGGCIVTMLQTPGAKITTKKMPGAKVD